MTLVSMLPGAHYSICFRYLHEVCSPSVAHKNLKSANIILDMGLNPHLSDCGLDCLHPSGDEVHFLPFVFSVKVFMEFP